MEGGGELAGTLLTRHVVEHEVDRARVGVRAGLPRADQADDGVPQGVCDRTRQVNRLRAQLLEIFLLWSVR